MNKYTKRQKENAEIAMRRLSDKANEIYSNSDFIVYEIEGDDEPLYDVLIYNVSVEATGLTFKQLNDLFEEYYDEEEGDEE